MFKNDTVVDDKWSRLIGDKRTESDGFDNE